MSNYKEFYCPECHGLGPDGNGPGGTYAIDIGCPRCGAALKIKTVEDPITHYCMSVDVSTATISVSPRQKIESELRTKIASLEEKIKELNCDLECWRDQLGEE